MAKLFKRRSRIPDSRFTPTDIEILKILRRRIQGGKQSRVVTDIHNLYEKEPWLVRHVRHVRFNENEWFYFVIRTKLAGVKKADSTKTSRRVRGSGRWKSTGTLTEIKDDNGVTVGSFQNIYYLVKKGGKEDTTGWVMHEFLLNTKGFQQVSLCRLRFKLGKDNCNAIYAPIRKPIMIGPPPEKHCLDAPVVSPQQWNIGSSSAQNMGQGSNYAIRGDFGSYGQKQNQILGNLAAYQNPNLGHHTDPSQFPMMSQGMMKHVGSCTSLAQNNGLSVVDDPMEAEQGIEHENSCSDHNDVGEQTSQQLHLGRDSNLLSTQDKYTSPSSVQAHDPENNNNVESSKKKEDPMNLGEEKWNNIMRLGEDVWNNLMSLNDVENINSSETIDLDDLKNLGAEDWDYIKSLGENDWNNLIISSNTSQPQHQKGFSDLSRHGSIIGQQQEENMAGHCI